MVAEADGRLVGLVHYLFHRSTITIEPTCYLQDLFTAEAARGRGVGRALIEAVYEQARLAGVVHGRFMTGGSVSGRRVQVSCTALFVSRAPCSARKMSIRSPWTT
jgi:GNAT superfamily N-acetyltransferase